MPQGLRRILGVHAPHVPLIGVVVLLRPVARRGVVGREVAPPPQEQGVGIESLGRLVQVRPEGVHGRRHPELPVPLEVQQRQEVQRLLVPRRRGPLQEPQAAAPPGHYVADVALPVLRRALPDVHDPDEILRVRIAHGRRAEEEGHRPGPVRRQRPGRVSVPQEVARVEQPRSLVRFDVVSEGLEDEPLRAVAVRPGGFLGVRLLEALISQHDEGRREPGVGRVAEVGVRRLVLRGSDPRRRRDGGDHRLLPLLTCAGRNGPDDLDVPLSRRDGGRRGGGGRGRRFVGGLGVRSGSPVLLLPVGPFEQ
mmetsp:Transcript_35495/g.69861  ORF Transcript_35495/g.69861 Transcript_35495/m.69861 type:complete len:308 (-) Transcript_35495:413-1336(-)